VVRLARENLWVPRMSSSPLRWTFVGAYFATKLSHALSFLYLAFVRVLRLIRLLRRDCDKLAIEVVVLRHEVAVLRLWTPKISSQGLHLGFLTVVCVRKCVGN
jgi:hypothetical protein